MKQNKVWKTLKTAFKWLFIITVIAWLLWLLSQFMEGHMALVERVNQQSQDINHLQGQLQNVLETNSELQKQLQLQDLRIDDLTNERITQQTPAVNIGGQPVVMNEEDVQTEVKPQLKDDWSQGWVPVVVVGALQVLKAFIKIPVPL